MPVIEQAYGITIEKGKIKRYPISPKGRWILEKVEGRKNLEMLEQLRQKVYSLKKKPKKSLDKIFEEALKKHQKLQIKINILLKE